MRHSEMDYFYGEENSACRNDFVLLESVFQGKITW